MSYELDKAKFESPAFRNAFKSFPVGSSSVHLSQSTLLDILDLGISLADLEYVSNCIYKEMYKRTLIKKPSEILFHHIDSAELKRPDLCLGTMVTNKGFREMILFKDSLTVWSNRCYRDLSKRYRKEAFLFTFGHELAHALGLTEWKDNHAMELMTDALTYKALNYSRVICSMHGNGISLKYSPAAAYLINELEVSGVVVNADGIERLMESVLGNNKKVSIRRRA